MRGVFITISLFFSVEAFSQDSCQLLENDGYRDLFEVRVASTRLVGLGGSKPSHVRAYECMKASENSEYWFEQLLENGSIAGQMYGLAGMRKGNPKRYEEYLSKYQGREQEILYLSGDSLFPKEMSEMLGMIASGEWPRY